MLGKTFKGLTDQVLGWQTERLLELADSAEARPAGDLRDAHGVLRVRPELVVEIAFDGVQASSRTVVFNDGKEVPANASAATRSRRGRAEGRQRRQPDGGPFR